MNSPERKVSKLPYAIDSTTIVVEPNAFAHQSEQFLAQNLVDPDLVDYNAAAAIYIVSLQKGEIIG